MKITHTHPYPELHEKYGAAPIDEVDEVDEVDEKVMARHHKVAAIINRHLEEIEAEILRLDQKTMNIDGAGNQAEIARQVLTVWSIGCAGSVSAPEMRFGATGSAAPSCQWTCSRTRCSAP